MIMKERIYDCFTGRYFMSSIEEIDCAAGVLRSRVSAGDIVTLNDLWEKIGLEKLNIGYCFYPSTKEEIGVEFEFGGDCVQMIVNGFVADSDALFCFRPTLRRSEYTTRWTEGRGPI